MTQPGFHPLKPRPPGSTAAVMTKAVSRSRCVADIAHKLGKGRTSITNATDPNQPPRFTLHDAREWARQDREVALVFADDFAALGGGYVVRGSIPPECASELAGAVACETGEMVTAIFKLMQTFSGSTADIRARAVKETEDVIGLAVALRNRLLASQD